MAFNLLNYRLCLAEPRRRKITAWSEHIPFAFALTQMIKPRLFVELGVHTGESYCAFCQAIDVLGLNTACCGIDTWCGDEHSGHYENNVLNELRLHHDPLYGRFSTLVRKTFDEALIDFQDRTVDLLHIDGFHSYEAVKHDFETWLPKMSNRGIIIFHDTNVHEKDFGVWRLWSSLKDEYPNFEFLFGSGLGVLGVGKKLPDGIGDLFNAVNEETTAINEFFGSLGKNNVKRKLLEDEIDRLTKELSIGLLKRLERNFRKKIIKPLKNLIIGRFKKSFA